MSHVILWEFRVRAGCEAAFEATYGPRGRWVQLFARGEGYLHTELLRDAALPGRYLTIDRWVSAEASARFKADHQAEYDELDVLCEAWTESEAFLGAFDL
jgi:heme-degrading monooxygenase HmoA